MLPASLVRAAAAASPLSLRKKCGVTIPGARCSWDTRLGLVPAAVQRMQSVGTRARQLVQDFAPQGCMD